MGVFLCAWIVAFAFLVRQNSFLSRTEPSLGDGVSVLGCTSTFWSGNDGCGFDGGNVSETAKGWVTKREERERR